MKNKHYLRIICVVAILILSLGVLVGCTGEPQFDASKQAEYIFDLRKEAENFDKSPFGTLSEFSDFTCRTSGFESEVTTSDIEAAEWIAEQFEKYGLQPVGDGLQEFVLPREYNMHDNGYNVVYIKKSNTPNAKKVVVGAHYDNAYALQSINGGMLQSEGVYNNATGVATLIQLARALQGKDLPFDVEFVAFGAGELNNEGSKEYLKFADKDNIALMINFDRVLGGDYIYMYSGEVDTTHNKYFYDIADSHHLQIAPLPYDMKNYLLTLPDSKMIYYNEAMATDSDEFGKAGINYVNFLSMNFSASNSNGAGVVEREGEQNIDYSRQDNMETFVTRLGGEEKAKEIINTQMNSVVNTILYAFEDPQFLNVMANSKEMESGAWLLDGTIISIVVYSTLGAIVVAIAIVYFVIKPKTATHKVYIDTPYGKMDLETRQIVPNPTFNPQPQKTKSAEDIFGLDGDKPKEDSAGEDKPSEPIVSVGDSKKDNEKDIFGDF